MKVDRDMIVAEILVFLAWASSQEINGRGRFVMWEYIDNDLEALRWESSDMANTYADWRSNRGLSYDD